MRALNRQTSPEFEALPTGLYPEMEVLNGESVEEYESLVCEFYDEYQPAGPTQRSLVDLLASSEWNLRRYRKIEAQQYDLECSVNHANGGGGNACEAYGGKIEVFARLHRRLESLERAIHRATRELERLGCTRRPAAPRPRPQIPTNEAILAAAPPPPPPDPDPDPAPDPDPPARRITADLLYDFPNPPKPRKLASFDKNRPKPSSSTRPPS